jgi:hypothetical protein
MPTRSERRLRRPPRITPRRFGKSDRALP